MNKDTQISIRVRSNQLKKIKELGFKYIDCWELGYERILENKTWEYLWNVMDEKTRFQLASVVSRERYVKDARMVFQKAKKNCGDRKPKFMVTDGLPAYRRAVKKEFTTNYPLQNSHCYFTQNQGTKHLYIITKSCNLIVKYINDGITIYKVFLFYGLYM